MATKSKSSGAQTIWEQHGVEREDVHLFFKVEGRGWNEVTLLRITDAEPFTKGFTREDRDGKPVEEHMYVLLGLEVEFEGQVMSWEITSRLLKTALMDAVSAFPATIWVMASGTGQRRRYVVSTERPIDAVSSRGSTDGPRLPPGERRCPKLECVLAAGHDGDHRDAAWWKQQQAAAGQQRVV